MIKAVILNRAYQTPFGYFFEFIGLAESETQKGRHYHTLVRILFSVFGSIELRDFTCECEAFIHGRMCKHVRKLFNISVRIARRIMSNEYIAVGGTQGEHRATARGGSM